MTLGDKIRKFRNLKGWTQKDLGKAVGFSASTADSRIRKYENDIMAPKNDIRQKLAEQLDVDISALSDISIQSLEDVMHILFFFEEELVEVVPESGLGCSILVLLISFSVISSFLASSGLVITSIFPA